MKWGNFSSPVTGRSALLVAFVTLASLLLPLHGRCGNLEMVEKNVEELESLNKEAVGMVEGGPRDGTIDLKAYVTVEGEKRKIRIDEVKISDLGTAPPGGKGKTAPPRALAVSVPPVESTIEYLEKNTLPTTSGPGVSK
ncbi:hypothetical protein LPW11_00740 [Geomonas sp. RF6]|uniref:hypothetical protein n=1 Tax=Geomonas sp. RF6 TaxID=2897342 RepID=UPI001E323FAF|nr:hypothetical protein [Geomonas sp. RF6]UFS70731.1 hypothetical protein LPW11_00740 [Geomonas sp. RF6]